MNVCNFESEQVADRELMMGNFSVQPPIGWNPGSLSGFHVDRLHAFDSRRPLRC